MSGRCNLRCGNGSPPTSGGDLLEMALDEPYMGMVGERTVTLVRQAGGGVEGCEF